MTKIKNTGYFKKASESNASSQPASNMKQGTSPESLPVRESSDGNSLKHEKFSIPRKVQLSSKILEAVKTASVKLNEVGFSGLAKDMAGLYKLAINKRFTVAFVGEFSRGKSTLVNRIIGEEILPVGNLPTTAMLTRIVYGEKSRMTVCGKNGKQEFPLSQDSWKGLTAANFGEQEPEGNVVVEYPDKWLGQFAIDFIDTPGAGDLEEKRAMLIERAMVCADSAVIATDATKALSKTEELFIRQKIMARGVPFVALVVTKLDLVNPSERVEVLSYLLKRLQALKISMPIIVADDIDIPGLNSIKGANILIGIEKFKDLVIAWMANENRRALMEKWLSINALAIVNSARAFLLQQKEIIDANDVEKEKLIRQRNNALSKLHSRWEELRSEMNLRCQKCIETFNKAAQDAGNSVVEDLQHEADRQPNPKDWFEKEYSYRVKRGLSAISLSLDNLVSKNVISDMNWLNRELQKQFKEIVGKEVAALMSKEDFQPRVDDKAVSFKSLKDKSVKATVVTSVVTLGAALMLGLAGGAPLILATLGVGTASNILSKKMFEKEVTRQREELKRLIKEQVPAVIAEASADSSTKIKIIYNDIISESHNTEARWMTTQRSLIRNSVESQGNHAKEKEQITSKLSIVEQIVKIFA